MPLVLFAPLQIWRICRDHMLKIFGAALLLACVLAIAAAPAPVASGQPGTVELLSHDTDSLTISASVEEPTLLMITDGYSRYFRAVPLQGSSQTHYDVLPADYALMAVPLAAGKHLLRLEYAPSGYVIGRWISLVALAGYILAVCVYLRSSGRRLPSEAHPESNLRRSNSH